MTEDNPLITVRRQWNDWKLAEYRLSELSGLHWDTISGGVNAKSPRDFLHAYVLCDRMESGELSHSCRHGKGPHLIKVCVTKTHNKEVVPQVLAKLEK